LIEQKLEFNRKKLSTHNWIRMARFFRISTIVYSIQSNSFIITIKFVVNVMKIYNRSIKMFIITINHFIRFYLNTLKQCKYRIFLGNFCIGGKSKIFSFSLKISGLKTRLISDEELISNQLAIENLSTELLAQINCWHQGRNEINLSAQST